MTRVALESLQRLVFGDSCHVHRVEILLKESQDCLVAQVGGGQAGDAGGAAHAIECLLTDGVWMPAPHPAINAAGWAENGTESR